MLKLTRSVEDCSSSVCIRHYGGCWGDAQDILKVSRKLWIARDVIDEYYTTPNAGSIGRRTLAKEIEYRRSR